MEIILAKTCASMTGALSRKHGYFCFMKNHRCYGKRKAKGTVPPDGHWRFIADLAQMCDGLLVSDIRVTADEVREALTEAHHFVAASNLRKTVYNARDIRNLKITFGL